MSQSDRKVIISQITQLLARREHSAVEITRKLVAKGYSPEVVELIVGEFTAKDIQSDYRYVESRIRNAMRRGIGPVRVSAELKQHRVNASLFSQVQDEIAPDWFELAKEVKWKRFGELTESDPKLRFKQQQFLLYRGFNSEQIKYAMSGD